MDSKGGRVGAVEEKAIGAQLAVLDLWIALVENEIVPADLAEEIAESFSQSLTEKLRRRTLEWTADAVQQMREG